MNCPSPVLNCSMQSSLVMSLGQCLLSANYGVGRKSRNESLYFKFKSPILDLFSSVKLKIGSASYVVKTQYGLQILQWANHVVSELPLQALWNISGTMTWWFNDHCSHMECNFLQECIFSSLSVSPSIVSVSAKWNWISFFDLWCLWISNINS